MMMTSSASAETTALPALFSLTQLQCVEAVIVSGDVIVGQRECLASMDTHPRSGPEAERVVARADVAHPTRVTRVKH